jgi:GAF domain-containing protein
MHEQMKSRLLAETTLDGVTNRILLDVIALQGAEFGDLQLVVDREWLVLVAQHGFPPNFLVDLRRLSRNSGTSCGRALALGRAVVIKDVSKDAEYAPYANIAEQCGFRSVQSTPLIASNGTCVGIVSTHFANVHEPTAIEMSTLATYGRLAGDRIAEVLGKKTVGPQADALFERMLAGAEAP